MKTTSLAATGLIGSLVFAPFAALAQNPPPPDHPTITVKGQTNATGVQVSGVWEDPHELVVDMAVGPKASRPQAKRQLLLSVLWQQHSLVRVHSSVTAVEGVATYLGRRREWPGR